MNGNPLHLKPQFVGQYQMILASVRSILGPDDAPDADWTRCTAADIVHALHGTLGRTTIMARLREMSRGGVLDASNNPTDFVPQYVHLLDELGEPA